MSKNNYINILILSGSGIIGGALNYIYHPLMLQYMTLEEFGIFGSLVGIFNILGIITGGIVLFLNKEVSSQIQHQEKIKYIFLESFKILGILGSILYLLFILFSPLIASFLKIENIFFIILVGLSIVFSFVGSSMDPILRGLKKFHILGISSIISPLIKLGIGVSLVAYGLGIYGAIIGFLSSTFVILCSMFFYIYHHFKPTQKLGNTRELLKDFYLQKRKIFHFFLVSFFFAVFMNIDVILVKNIFPSEIAGGYAGISVLGKFLIFLLLSIETVYYGQIMEHTQSSTPHQLLKNPLIIIAVIGSSAFIFNIFLGKWILQIIKPELVIYFPIYLISLVYYTLLAYISFFSKILIGWGKYRVNFLLGFFSILLLILVYTFGKNDLQSFIACFIGVGSLLSLSLGYMFYTAAQKK